jgi:hypothetical protein
MAQKDNKPTASSSAPAESGSSGLGDAYQLTASEKAAVSRLERRRSGRHPAPRVKITQGADGVTLSLEHERQDVGYRLLAEALGTADSDFVSGLVDQLAGATRRNGKLAEAELNFLLAVIKDVKPRDQCEAMLAAQMAVVHRATMTFARRLGNVDTIDQQDSAINGFAKLARTYLMQMDALKRARTGGEQTVTVQHVNVNEGAQAIVGNVTTQSGTRTAAVAQTKASAPARAHSATAPKPNLDRRPAAPVARRGSRKNGRRSSA